MIGQHASFYTVRNWLVHEGQSIGSMRLFHGDRIEDGLRLLAHADAVLHIEKMCRIAVDANDDPKKVLPAWLSKPLEERAG